MTRPLPFLAWALAGGFCVPRVRAARTLVRPTNQPATLGQDQQECGFLLLPREFMIWPATTRWFASRAVEWQSMDRATFVTCYQGIFPWIPQAVHCFVDSKLLFKSEVFRDTDRLPGEVNVTSLAGFDTVVLRDCTHAVQYVLQVSRATPDLYQVYNRLGQLVARSRKDTGFAHEEVLRLEDDEGHPTAVAQTPALEHSVVYGASGAPLQPDAGHHEDADRDRQAAEEQAEPDVGVLSPWQLRFYSAHTSSSSLLIAQNRWVLAALVQDRALRSVWQQPSTFSRLLVPSLVLVVLLGGLVCVGKALVDGLFRPRQEVVDAQALAKQLPEVPAPFAGPSLR